MLLTLQLSKVLDEENFSILTTTCGVSLCVGSAADPRLPVTWPPRSSGRRVTVSPSTSGPLVLLREYGVEQLEGVRTVAPRRACLVCGALAPACQN